MGRHGSQGRYTGPGPLPAAGVRLLAVHINGPAVSGTGNWVVFNHNYPGTGLMALE